MSKLNVKPTSTQKTHEGAVASRATATQQLERTLMSCLLWEKTFYEEGEDAAGRMARLAVEAPWSDVVDLVLRARHDQGLRHAPLWVMISALEHPPEKRPGWSGIFTSICNRPDMMTEALAMYWKDKRRPVPAALKKGLRDAFVTFGEYQLAKYNRDGIVKLKDVMALVHPKPDTDRQAETWKLLGMGELKAPDTWEVALSRGDNKKDAWTRLIEEDKLGALATIRNVRNMVGAGVSMDLIRLAIQRIDPTKVWPHQYLAAARAVPSLEPEIESAMLHSVRSFPKLPGTTLIMVDASGSMSSVLSSRSDVSRMDAAAGLAIVLREVCEHANVWRFNTDASEVPARRGFALRDALGQPQGGTDLGRSYVKAVNRNVDRVVVVTDEQSISRPGNPIGAGYMINVASYQNGIGYGPWTTISGWSDHIVRYIIAREGHRHTVAVDAATQASEDDE